MLLAVGLKFVIFGVQVMDRCVSGKRMYQTQEIAEDVLIETWTRFDFNERNGPVAVYCCDDCGTYHLTSKGPMNEKLARAIADGLIKRQSEANRWSDKFRRK
jgi:hypothetical protein